MKLTNISSYLFFLLILLPVCYAPEPADPQVIENTDTQTTTLDSTQTTYDTSTLPDGDVVVSAGVKITATNGEFTVASNVPQSVQARLEGGKFVVNDLSSFESASLRVTNSESTYAAKNGNFRLSENAQIEVIKGSVRLKDATLLPSSYIIDSNGNQRSIHGAISSFDGAQVFSQPGTTLSIDEATYTPLTDASGGTLSFNMDLSVAQTNGDLFSMVAKIKGSEKYIGSFSGGAEILDPGVVRLLSQKPPAESSLFFIPTNTGLGLSGRVEGANLLVCLDGCGATKGDKIEYTSSSGTNEMIIAIQENDARISLDDGFFDVSVTRIDGPPKVFLSFDNLNTNEQIAFELSKGSLAGARNIANLKSKLFYIVKDPTDGLDKVFGIADGRFLFNSEPIGFARKHLRDLNPTGSAIRDDGLNQFFLNALAGTTVVHTLGDPDIKLTHYTDIHFTSNTNLKEVGFIGEYQLQTAARMKEDGVTNLFVEGLPFTWEPDNPELQSWVAEAREVFPNGIPNNPTDPQLDYAAQNGAWLILAAVSEVPVTIHKTIENEIEEIAIQSLIDQRLLQAETAQTSGDLMNAQALYSQASLLMYETRTEKAKEQILNFFNSGGKRAAVLYGGDHLSENFGGTTIDGKTITVESSTQNLDSGYFADPVSLHPFITNPVPFIETSNPFDSPITNIPLTETSEPFDIPFDDEVSPLS